jgi:periplasmic protein CpxP/Spy
VRARLFALLLLAAAAGSAGAQRPDDEPGPQREQLEARFRQAFARAVRERVGLSEDQMRRLGPINERFADERRRLQMEERTARMAVQRALRTPELADSADVARNLDRLLEVQKRRVELLQSEQRELAKVMTPIQRARFMALQEQLRRQVEQRSQQRGGAPGRRMPPPF